ncbi:MAG: tetratricopeptide repeat protein [Candidatus Binatia bacterium]
MPLVRRLHPLLIVALTFIAYHATFTAPFLFDDAQFVKGSTLHTLSWAVVQGTTRPLVQLSLALNWAAGGADVVGYHVVNFVVHVLAALALYGIVRRTLASTRFTPRWRNVAPELALATSLVFAVHPLQSESVSYVIQRAESLMGFFYLATLYAVIRGVGARRPWPWYAAAITACGLGMLTKPVMVTAPFIALMYDRVFLAGSWARAWRERGALHAALFATWLLLILLLGGGAHESAATSGFAMRDVTWGEFVRSQPGVILRYLQLVVWPHGLVLDYGWPPAVGTAATVVPTLVLAAVGGGAAWAVRGVPALGFLVAAFLVTLAPSSSVIPIRDLAFEHRMYLPLAALAALLVAAGWALLPRARLAAASERRVAAAVAASVVVALTLLTIDRNHDYRSSIAMWTDVTTKRPANTRAWSNLAQALMAEGRADDAMPAARTALQLDPDFADAHIHLGHALAARREYTAAVRHYADAVRLNPESSEAQNNWGAALADQKRYAEAEPHYVEALRLTPDYAEAMNNLAVVLMNRGEFDRAEALYRDSLRLSSRNAEAYSNFGGLRTRQKRFAEAVQQYEQALALKPDSAEIHFNLALALAGVGRRDEAAAHANDALRLRPDLAALVKQAGLLPAR